MVELKYKSLPFSKISEEQLKITTSRLMLKINFITGWALYEDTESLSVLKEQFELKLIESYPLVNVDEMEYAFRSNTTVKDWGKYMNLALIDEVMIPYLESRREVSKIEEQQTKELPPPKTEPMSDEEFIEMNYRTWKNRPALGTSVLAYEALERMGKINLTKEEKQEKYKQAEANLKGRMASDNMWREELENIYNSLNPDHWKERVRNECRRIEVENYFKTL